MPAGRPQKYGGNMSAIPLYIPQLYSDILKDEAKNLGISVNEYMNGLIAASDKELTAQLLKNLISMRNDIKSNMERIEKNFKHNIGNALEYLTSTLEENPELADTINKATVKQQSTYVNLLNSSGLNEALEVASNNAYAEIEVELLKQGQAVRRSTLLKNLIKKSIVELNKNT